MHLDELIATMTNLGYGISVDAYPDGTAAASVLKKTDDFWHALQFGRGPTPRDALLDAIGKLSDVEKPKHTAWTF